MYIDLIIKIKNAQNARKETLKTSYSKMDKAVLDVLEKRGFIKNVEVKGKGYKKYIEMNLEGKRKIKGVKILSKPSVKTYSGYKKLKPVKSGFGMTIISTPKGIMTESEAKKLGIGGELLLELW